MRDQVSHETVSSIINSISEVLATATFIQEELRHIANTNSYKAPVTSARIGKQLTSTLLSKVFDNPIAYGKIAFGTVADRYDENHFWLLVTFKSYDWAHIKFDIKQFEQNVQAVHGTLHPYNAYHEMLVKIERESISYIPRAHSISPDFRKKMQPMDLRKLRTTQPGCASDGDVPLVPRPSVFGDLSKKNSVESVVDAKLNEAKGLCRGLSFLRRSFDGMQPCHRESSSEIRQSVQRSSSLFKATPLHQDNSQKKKVGFIPSIVMPRV